MGSRIRLSLVVSCTLLMEVTTALAQQSCSTSQALSPPLGKWEVMDGKGGSVGIDIDRAGVMPGNGSSAFPKASEVAIIVYHRRLAEYCEDLHFFTLAWHCGPDKAATVAFKKDRLVIHTESHMDGSTPIDVNLLFDRNRNVWSGNFRSGLFHGRHAMLSQAPTSQKMLQPCIH